MRLGLHDKVLKKDIGQAKTAEEAEFKGCK